jgi:hypothetical protein
MKKLIMLFISMLAVLTVRGQIIRPELELGYGKWTANDIGNSAEKYTADLLGSGVNTNNMHNSSSGSFQAGVYLKLLKISVGVTGAYERINVTDSYSGNASVSGMVATQNDYWTIMGRLKWNYFGVVGVHFYGGVAGGTTTINTLVTETAGNGLKNNRSSTTRVAYQITPLGVSIGHGFSVFAEVGYGYLGIVNGGISFKF